MYDGNGRQPKLHNQKEAFAPLQTSRSYSISFNLLDVSNFSGAEYRRTTVPSLEKENLNRFPTFTSLYKTPWNEEVSRRSRATTAKNVQKSVMHVQSCCFADPKTYRLFCNTWLEPMSHFTSTLSMIVRVNFCCCWQWLTFWQPVQQYPFDTEDDHCTGCWNLSHCQQQQSYSGLCSPGRSHSTYKGQQKTMEMNLHQVLIYQLPMHKIRTHSLGCLCLIM